MERPLPLTPASPTKAVWLCSICGQGQAACPQVPTVPRARPAGSWHCSLYAHPMHCGWALNTVAAVLLPDGFFWGEVPTGRPCSWRGLLPQSDSGFGWEMAIQGSGAMKLPHSLDSPSQPCCPDLSNRVQRADFESLVTCMEGSIRLDVSCGCICSAGAMGGAGWGGPAGKLGCFYVSLSVELELVGEAESCGKRSLHGHTAEQKPYHHLNPWGNLLPTYGEMQQPTLKLPNNTSVARDEPLNPTRRGGVFSRIVSGKVLLTQRSCEEAVWILSTGPAEGRSFHGSVMWETMSSAECCAFPSVRSHDDSA